MTGNISCFSAWDKTTGSSLTGSVGVWTLFTFIICAGTAFPSLRGWQGLTKITIIS